MQRLTRPRLPAPAMTRPPRYPALASAMTAADVARALGRGGGRSRAAVSPAAAALGLGGDLEQGAYSCELCTKKFRTSQGLKYHNMHHTGTCPVT